MVNVVLSDCSFYQYKYSDSTLKEITGWIDFGRMRTMSPAVIIRAGQGSWKDIAFDISWKNAKAAGLARGSYFFYDSRADPKKQAQLWVSTLGNDFGELPMFCDFEDTYGGQYGRWQDWYDFIEDLKSLLPASKEIAIYTAYYYWFERTVAKYIPAASLEYFKQYPLWIANYKVDKPLVPKPWTEWTFWQFTDHGDGSLYGVESKNIDLNYFNGDLAAFRERFGLGNIPSHDGEIPPEPQPGENKMYEMTTISGGTRIRSDHNVYADVLSSVAGGVTVSGDEMWTAPADGSNVLAGDQWMHITYNGITGWMAFTHMGRPICKDFKIVGEPVPEPTPTPTYQDVAVAVNVYDNQIVVLVNGEEWVRKA